MVGSGGSSTDGSGSVWAGVITIVGMGSGARKDHLDIASRIGVRDVGDYVYQHKSHDKSVRTHGCLHTQLLKQGAEFVYGIVNVYVWGIKIMLFVKFLKALGVAVHATVAIARRVVK